MDTLTTTSRTEVAEWFPTRTNGTNVNKRNFGHIVVVGGSPSYPEAPILTAEAGARIGAGKVSLLFPKALTLAIVSRLSPVVVTMAVETGLNGFFNAESSTGNTGIATAGTGDVLTVSLPRAIAETQNLL